MGGAGEALFVAGKAAKKRTHRRTGPDRPLLYTRSPSSRTISGYATRTPEKEDTPAKPATIWPIRPADYAILNDDTAELVFDEPQWASNAGRSAVL